MKIQAARVIYRKLRNHPFFFFSFEYSDNRLFPALLIIASSFVEVCFFLFVHRTYSNTFTLAPNATIAISLRTFVSLSTPLPHLTANGNIRNEQTEQCTEYTFSCSLKLCGQFKHTNAYIEEENVYGK